MSWNYGKKKAKEPTLTDADRKRIAAIDSNPWTVGRKFKYLITLAHPKIKATLALTIYGKDMDEIKTQILWHHKWFSEKDAKWKVIEAKDLKLHQD